MSTHVLKTSPLWFDRVADGSKTAELRKHDRDFQIGDELVLVRDDERAWHPKPSEDGGWEVEALRVEVTHVLPASIDPQMLQPEHSLLSFKLTRGPEMEQGRDLGLAWAAF
jgi:hypothetical protein